MLSRYRLGCVLFLVVAFAAGCDRREPTSRIEAANFLESMFEARRGSLDTLIVAIQAQPKLAYLGAHNHRMQDGSPNLDQQTADQLVSLLREAELVMVSKRNGSDYYFMPVGSISEGDLQVNLAYEYHVDTSNLEPRCAKPFDHARGGCYVILSDNWVGALFWHTIEPIQE